MLYACLSEFCDDDTNKLFKTSKKTFYENASHISLKLVMKNFLNVFLSVYADKMSR